MQIVDIASTLGGFGQAVAAVMAVVVLPLAYRQYRASVQSSNEQLLHDGLASYVTKRATNLNLARYMVGALEDKKIDIESEKLITDFTTLSYLINLFAAVKSKNTFVPWLPLLLDDLRGLYQYCGFMMRLRAEQRQHLSTQYPEFATISRSDEVTLLSDAAGVAINTLQKPKSENSDSESRASKAMKYGEYWRFGHDLVELQEIMRKMISLRLALARSSGRSFPKDHKKWDDLSTSTTVWR